MQIVLEGLNDTQKVLCDIMWALDTTERVEAFIATLPKKHRREALTMVEMMRLAFTDHLQTTDEATQLLKGIFK
jgi:hypothetical protein